MSQADASLIALILYEGCLAFVTFFLVGRFALRRRGTPITYGSQLRRTEIDEEERLAIDRVVQFGLRALPGWLKAPQNLTIEVISHQDLNRKISELHIPASLFGYSTDSGMMMVLSDMVLRLPLPERNRHILHEVWHIAQLASGYHPGLENSERDAAAFAGHLKDRVS